MPKFFHVGFNFSGAPKIKELEVAFSAAGDWMRYSANCWVIWSARSPQDIYVTLKPYLTNEDQFLIVEINMFERNGWLPPWMWEWMNSRAFPPNPFSGVSGLGNALAPHGGIAPYNPLNPFGSYDPNKK